MYLTHLTEKQMNRVVVKEDSGELGERDGMCRKWCMGATIRTIKTKFYTMYLRAASAG